MLKLIASKIKGDGTKIGFDRVRRKCNLGIKSLFSYYFRNYFKIIPFKFYMPKANKIETSVKCTECQCIES